MNPKLFSKRFSASLENTESRLAAFLEDPSANNIHDIRTSIRRTEASISLLPKNLRGGEARRYLESAKSLFRATTPLRDIDIVGVELSKFSSVPGVRTLLDINQRKRTKLLRKATRYAESFGKMTVPSIKSSNISQSELSKRRRKVLRRLNERLRNEAQDLLSNPAPDDLHEFRKTCKMLRYTIEIGSKRNQELRKTLVQIQQILGRMMDIHTTLRFISESSLGVSAVPIIEQLGSESIRAYKPFPELLKERFMPMLANLEG